MTAADVLPHAWYSPRRLAPVSGFSYGTVLGWCERGLLAHRKSPGGQIRIRGRVFLRFVADLERVRRVGRPRTVGAGLGERDERAMKRALELVRVRART